MDLELSHCLITVHDLDEALGFYRDVLGLQVRTDVRMGIDALADGRRPVRAGGR